MIAAAKIEPAIGRKAPASEATVKAHVSAILQKLGVESRTSRLVIAAAKIEAGNGRAPKRRR